eukprot:CAMPEP_0170516346 /NCGR_PEP_ID=MMETSP0209-20121228/2583_1 /TAXON_ID=665100 ORGANISM="Litonotus pictus, Strain P1" /NCGR_SAMPLE_ID=MMETSP0209 /ASSEMBLY_ACC=CAM_ASM_000301 /LENGTH=490 /DNA_ID=CAMNT_0010801191 /DNA_START=137 /DNA_END=1609 /DNA_ORIENTATION=-
MKKYNLKTGNDFIENEINTFIGCDNLSDKDLKILDSRIHLLLKEKGLLNNRNKSEPKTYSAALAGANTAQTVSNLPNPITQSLNVLESNLNNEKVQNTEAPEAKDRNIMSGASHLSNLFKTDNPGSRRRNDPEVPEEDLIKPKKRQHRFEFEHEDDMWNAFNNVNSRIFQQERIDEKMKDSEIKRRTKEDLDNQIKQKLLRLEGERKKNNEYHTILVKHIDHMNLLEEQKQARIKAKILKEKENRDKQMWDQNYRKKVEKIQLRKFENQLLDYLNKEIKDEKESTLKKKAEALEQLKRTLVENEANKVKKEKIRQEEAEDDMRSVEEYNRILEKQENDRVNYFKNIEMKSTDFMSKATDTVLKKLKDKNDKADKIMNDYLIKKEELAVQEEKNEMLRKYQGKKDMKKFLDNQVEEKKKLSQFEKDIDEEQARIINRDCELYEEYKKDSADKIKEMNMNNCNYIKDQIDSKQAAKDYAKMSKLRYLRDQNL